MNMRIAAILISVFFSFQVFAQDDSEPLYIQTVLTAQHKATLSSPGASRINTLDLYNGDLFKKGDTLISFDCRVLDAQAAQAQAIVKKAKARYEALKKLKEMKSSSALEHIVAQSDYEAAKASLSEVNSLKEDCVLKAPFDGRITERSVNPHETVKPGQKLLAIASLDNLQAKLLVPSDWLSKVNQDSHLEIKIHETGERYKAKIIRIGGSVDPVSQSIELFAEMEEPHPELLPGMSGFAYFNK